MTGWGWCLLVLTLCLNGPAQARDGLMTLVPPVDLYTVGASPELGFDVAGIRCAGLYTAQHDWSRKHGLRGPTKAQLKDVELHLTRAEIYRKEQGQSITRAYETTLRDVQRVIGLYTNRFSGRAAGEGHPWQGDGLIRSDAAYCEALGGRQ